MPSPAGVGEIAVTRISLPTFPESLTATSVSIFAIVLPNLINPSGLRLIFEAISSIGAISFRLAISISLKTSILVLGFSNKRRQLKNL